MADTKLEAVIAVRDEASAQLRRVGQEVETLGAGSSELSNKFGQLTASFTAGNLAAMGIERALSGLQAAFSAVVGHITGTIERIDALGDAAARLNISVERLSTLRFAFSQLDASAGSLDQAIEILSRRIGDALMDGAGQAAKAFEAAGISVRDAAGNVKSADQVLLEFADRLKSGTLGIREFQISTDLLGRGSGDLLNALRAGSEQIRELEQRARSLGIEVSETTKKSIDEFSTSLGALKDAMAAVGQVAIGDLAKGLKQVTDFALDALTLLPLFKDQLVAVGEAAVRVSTAFATFGLSEFAIQAAKSTGLVEKFRAEWDKTRTSLQNAANAVRAIQTAMAGKPAAPGSAGPQLLDLDMKGSTLAYPEEAMRVQRAQDAREAQALRDQASETMRAYRASGDAVERMLAKIDNEQKDAAKSAADLEERQMRLAESLDAADGAWAEYNQKLEAYQQRTRESSDATAGFQAGLQDFVNRVGQAGDQMREFANNISQGMANAFSSFFFDVMERRINNLRDAFRSLARFMIQAMQQAAAIAAGNAFGSLFGQALGAAPAASSAGAAPIPPSVAPPPPTGLAQTMGTGGMGGNFMVGGASNVTFNVYTHDTQTTKDLIKGVIAEVVNKANKKPGFSLAMAGG